MKDSDISGDQLLQVLAALANRHRLRIIAALHEGTTYVSQMARDLGISRPLAAHALQKLADAGLVQSETTIADDGKAGREQEELDWLVARNEDPAARIDDHQSSASAGLAERHRDRAHALRSRLTAVLPGDDPAEAQPASTLHR